MIANNYLKIEKGHKEREERAEPDVPPPPLRSKTTSGVPLCRRKYIIKLTVENEAKNKLKTVETDKPHPKDVMTGTNYFSGYESSRRVKLSKVGKAPAAEEPHYEEAVPVRRNNRLNSAPRQTLVTETPPTAPSVTDSIRLIDPGLVSAGFTLAGVRKRTGGGTPCRTIGTGTEARGRGARGSFLTAPRDALAAAARIRAIASRNWEVREVSTRKSHLPVVVKTVPVLPTRSFARSVLEIDLLKKNNTEDRMVTVMTRKVLPEIAELKTPESEKRWAAMKARGVEKAPASAPKRPKSKPRPALRSASKPPFK